MMDIKRARQYALLSFGAALFMLLFTFLFSITLAYQTYNDGMGGGVNVLPQFIRYFPMKGKNLMFTSPFNKGDDYIDKDSDRKLIAETLTRYYLEMKYTAIPDKTEMLRRWGPTSPLVRISTPQMHKKLMGSNLETRINELREVETVNVLKITPAEDITNRYVAEVEINTIKENGTLQSRKLNVTLDFKYNKSRRSFFREPINPYGLYFFSIREQPI